ncbi:MAG: glycoside hydrolase family 97 catalytic domain-containing protein, partial [Bacteroidota bacterium]
HGCTVPRGWSRTYPNLMTMESVKGAECYIFDDSYSANAPAQNTILPFTRNVVGPMDYTPVTFTDNVYPHRTTYGHELALGALFQSGVQHFADRITGYTDLPNEVQDVLRDLPADWDETRYVAGTPGTDAILARRRGTTWYVAGINGTDRARTFDLDLSRLGNLGSIRVVTDGDGPRAFAPVTEQEAIQDSLSLTTLPYGGFLLIADQK